LELIVSEDGGIPFVSKSWDGNTSAKGWTYHQVDSHHLSDHKRYTRKGRQTPRLLVKAIDWQIQAHVRPAEAAIEHQKHGHACFVIGTNIGTSELQDTEVITAYKRQSQVEGGCGFSKIRCFSSRRCLSKSPAVSRDS
jgi:hypothetical protein